MPASRKPRQALTPVVLGDADAFSPTRERPVRVRGRNLAADTHLEPHRHDWGQLTYCDRGVMQVSAQAPQEVSYIVPPSRAVWVPPRALHAVTVIEAAQLRTLYVCAAALPAAWGSSRVIRVSALLRELIAALDAEAAHSRDAASTPTPREQALTALLLDEISRADTEPLGVPLPDPERGDKRLRTLCHAVLREHDTRRTLAEWAHRVGASERTLARLFREELGLGWLQWRQQVVIAQALPRLARGEPVATVAADSGYESLSAFSAMFRTAMGHPPSHYQS